MPLCDAHHGLEKGIESIDGKLTKILDKLNATDKRVDRVYTTVYVIGALLTAFVTVLKLV